MADIEEITLEFTADTAQLQQSLQNAENRMNSFHKVAASLKNAITSAFEIPSVTQYIGEAIKAVGSLDDQLLVLRLSMGKLKSAIGQAIAPIASVFLSAIQQAVYGVTRLVNSIGLVMGALFGSVQKKAVVTAGKSGKALRRFLADFDEIERLNGSSGGSSGSTVEWKTISKPLTPELQKTVDSIRALIAPLQEISFAKVKEAADALRASMADLGKTVGEGLLWAWHNVLVPLSKWSIEDAAPAAVDVLSAAFTLLNAVLHPVLDAIRAILPAFAPVVSFLGQAVTMMLEKLEQRFLGIAAVFSEKGSALQSSFTAIGQCVAVTWEIIEPILTALRNIWEVTMDYISSKAAVQVEACINVFTSLMEFLTGVFSGNWASAWEGLGAVLKGVVNSVIACLNGLLTALVAGINAAATQLNKLKITAPDWLPGIGGKTFGVNIPTLTAPQIPQLARGAVIPPNAPFLAMLGDQHSGTNIEAPLSTIQEAVAATMEGFTEATLAGHEATVGVLQQILEAVLGIEIGDEVLGAAANRYNARLSAMRGDS